MPERKKRNATDKLLDPKYNLIGSRLILSQNTDRPEPYEVTILEWSPTRRYVKLQYHNSGSCRWVECWDYEPVVLEVVSGNDDLAGEMADLENELRALEHSTQADQLKDLRRRIFGG